MPRRNLGRGLPHTLSLLINLRTPHLQRPSWETEIGGKVGGKEGKQGELVVAERERRIDSSPVQPCVPPRSPVQLCVPPRSPVQLCVPPRSPVQLCVPPRSPVQLCAPSRSPVQLCVPPPAAHV
eukprot:361150-Chlamydomonas_euryale.AAC.3